MSASAFQFSHPDWSRRAIAAGFCLAALSLLVVAAMGNAVAVTLLTLSGLSLLMSFRQRDAGLSAIVAVAFLLPFAVMPLDFGLKPSFLLITVTLCYLRWVLHLVRREPMVSPPLVASALVVLFALLVLAAGLWGLNFADPSWFEMRKLAEFLLNLGLFFLTLTALRSPAEIRLLVTVMAVAGTLGAGLGLLLHSLPQTMSRAWLDQLAVFDYPAGAVALRYINDDPAGVMRAIGTAVDPNLLGAACVLTACVLLPFPFLGRTWAVRAGAGLALGVLLITIYLTYSRNALLALGAVGLFLALVRFRALLPLGLGGVILLLLLPQTQHYVQRLVEGLMRQDLATQMRLTEYRNALAIIRDYPWTGIGFFGQPSVAYREGVSSIYLAAATFMGLPALVLYLAILGQPLVLFFRTPWRSHELEPWILGLAGTVIALAMTGLFDHFYLNLLYPHMSALFWILLGACTAALRLAGRQALETPTTPTATPP